MSDTTSTSPPTQAAPSTRQRAATRPTVSVRPVAVGALNAATIAGATAVAAGGGLVLAGLAGGAALAATAAGARKTGHGKANKQETGSRFRRTTTGGGSTGGGGGRTGRANSGGTGGGSGRSGRSAAGRSSAATPGGRAPGSKPSPFPRGNGSGGRNSAGGRSTPGSSRRGGLLGGIGRNKNTAGGSGGGHRRAGSKPGSSSRAPLTAAKVAAARRRIANRRQPGPRLSDAVHKATQPGANGKKPTAREAFRNARRAVTGDNPKNRGPVRRAAAGLIAGGIAAGKIAYAKRRRRKRQEAARAAKNARIVARQDASRVGTAVRRAPGAVDNAPTARKPAPAPVPRRATTGSTPSPTTLEGTITMVHPLLAISEDFLAAARRNQPEGMLQVTAEARMLAQVMENFTLAMKIRYEMAQEHPIHHAIKDMYGVVHVAQSKVMQAAAEIHPAIEKAHFELLNRLRNPGVGEEMWDVSRNRGAA